MKTTVAKFLYCNSVGWDTSEMPIAAEREAARQALYKQRTGVMDDYEPGGEIGWFIMLGNPFVWLGLIVAVIMVPQIVQAWL